MATAKENKVILWAGLGVGVAALIIAYLNYIKSPQAVSSPQGFSLDLPSGSVPQPQTYQPATFNIPGLISTGSNPAANPGTTALTLSFPGGDALQPYGAPQLIPNNGVGGCGCNASDSLGPCTTPGATVNAFGDPATAAAALFANLGPSITDAFDVGQQIREEQNLELLASGSSALYVPPAPKPNLGALASIFGG